MITGIIFKTLKGRKGFLSYDISTIDVGLVLDMHCERRLFCIFDRDYPYELDIKYHLPPSNINTSRFTHQIISRRYKNEKEAHDEMSEIKRMKVDIEKFKHEYLKRDKKFI